MRKTLSKEVTFTTFNVSKMTTENNQPKIIELPSEKLIGLIPHDKIIKRMQTKHKTPSIMVYNVEVTKHTYEMELEEFLKHATPKEEK